MPTIHVYEYANIHKREATHIQTYKYAKQKCNYTKIRVYTYTHKDQRALQIGTSTHKRINTFTHIQLQSQNQPNNHTFKHTHIHAYTNTRIHIFRYTNMQTYEYKHTVNAYTSRHTRRFTITQTRQIYT